MTHDLVESMAGHRTRLAQLAADRWHDGEDEALETYLKSSKAMDQSTARLIAMIPRGWLVVGLLGLAPAFIYGSASSRESQSQWEEPCSPIGHGAGWQPERGSWPAQP